MNKEEVLALGVSPVKLESRANRHHLLCGMTAVTARGCLLGVVGSDPP